MSPFSQKYLVLSAKNHHQNDYSKNVPQGPDSGCIGLYVFKVYTAKYRVFLSDLIRVTNIWDDSVLIWIIESILLRHCVKRRRSVDVIRRVWMTQPRMIVYSHKVRSILEKHLSRLDSPLINSLHCKIQFGYLISMFLTKNPSRHLEPNL